MSPCSNASPHGQPQHTEATKRVMRKRLPNTFGRNQGLDPSGEKLRNKINSFCQENQESGRKLPVPVLATEEKAVSLGRTVRLDSIFASPPCRLPPLLNVSTTKFVQAGPQPQSFPCERCLAAHRLYLCVKPLS